MNTRKKHVLTRAIQDNCSQRAYCQSVHVDRYEDKWPHDTYAVCECTPRQHITRKISSSLCFSALGFRWNYSIDRARCCMCVEFFFLILRKKRYIFRRCGKRIKMNFSAHERNIHWRIDLLTTRQIERNWFRARILFFVLDERAMTNLT